MSSGKRAIDAPLAIEVQLQAEKASALRLTASKLEKALAELTEVERALQGQVGPARARLMDRYRELRAEAEKRRWYLVIQREAIGLKQHDDVDALYPLPPPVR